MAPLITDADKETIKRSVPKPANKIHAAAVSRLYVAHPNQHKWIYTGLQGAAVLANDLVGNTLWIKLVDISGSNHGVLWDQEIYDPFYYNQDRTFFHSFELEDCLAGLSFANEKEAKQFKKKIDDREKNASKETKATPFQGAGAQSAATSLPNGKTHSRFGLSNLLGGQRHSSAPQIPPAQPQAVAPPPQQQATVPPHKAPNQAPKGSSRDRASSLDNVDPSWRGLLGELLEMGITEEQIQQNQDFIKNLIERKKANGEPVEGSSDRHRSVPTPPVPVAGGLKSISPQHSGNSTSRRGPAPAPPQPRRSRPENLSVSSTSQRRSPSPPQERTPSPPRSQYHFKAPPPIADAGRFANAPTPSLPMRPRATSNVANPGPPPPPRPPKTPLDEQEEQQPRFGVPPPFQGERTPTAAPPPPPSRAPPSNSSPRHTKEKTLEHHVPPTAVAPPRLPPKQPTSLPLKQIPSPSPSAGPPPPPPARSNAQPPLPPAPAPRPVPSAPSSAGPPLPPPLPSMGALPPPPLPSSNAPPPPPLPSSSNSPPPPRIPSSNGPLPPPLPAGKSGANAPPLPKASGGKEDMLASIRASGGIGGGGLRKVADKDKRDRSAAAVPGAEPTTSSGGASAAPSGGGNLQDALNVALNKRKQKVSASDDEENNEDDWDK